MRKRSEVFFVLSVTFIVSAVTLMILSFTNNNNSFSYWSLGCSASFWICIYLSRRSLQRERAQGTVAILGKNYPQTGMTHADLVEVQIKLEQMLNDIQHANDVPDLIIQEEAL